MKSYQKSRVFRTYFRVLKEEPLIQGYQIEILAVASLVGITIVFISKKKFKKNP